MPVIVGVTMVVIPVTEVGIPLPAAGEAVHVNIYALVVPVCVATRVVELPGQIAVAVADADTPSGVVTLAVTAVLVALSQVPL